MGFVQRFLFALLALQYGGSGLELLRFLRAGTAFAFYEPCSDDEESFISRARKT